MRGPACGRVAMLRKLLWLPLLAIALAGISLQSGGAAGPQPRPHIIHPRNGSIICGLTELIGREGNAALHIEKELVHWHYSLNGGDPQNIGIRRLPADSRGLPGGATFWNTAPLAHGTAAVTL